ncbi:MAG: hypothetical protein M3Q70_03535 [bacterium]|nr:hypothetical protein [bacterium]
MRGFFVVLLGDPTTDPSKEGRCDNCWWQFGNESSDENWFSIMKFGARGT